MARLIQAGLLGAIIATVALCAAGCTSLAPKLDRATLQSWEIRDMARLRQEVDDMADILKG